MRVDWTALPEAVTKGVADRAGGSHIIPATTGDHAEIAATVTGTNGKMFIKAAHTDFGVRSLRFELRVSEAVSGSHSPTVEWHFEEAGCLVVGIEHYAGQALIAGGWDACFSAMAHLAPDLARTFADELLVPDEGASSRYLAKAFKPRYSI